MRLPNSAHESGPWRIREIVPDFIARGRLGPAGRGRRRGLPGAARADGLLRPGQADSLPTRFLWRLRDLLGSWFGLGRISAPADGGGDGKLPIPGTSETSLADRLPDDLRGTAADVDFGSLPFEPLYRTDDEFAAEVSNRTVHGVMHLAWADQGEGRYQGQMAVYVKPRGRFGKGYMALIKPFRHWIVYPALMRQTERTWNRRVSGRPST